eukprot:3913961-Amphidinium_carterae.2
MKLAHPYIVLPEDLLLPVVEKIDYGSRHWIQQGTQWLTCRCPRVMVGDLGHTSFHDHNEIRGPEIP